MSQSQIVVSSSVLAVMLLLGHGYTAHRARVNPGLKSAYAEIQTRLRAWWVMLFLLEGALSLSLGVATFFFACISFFGLREYLSRIPTRKTDRNVLFLMYLLIPIQFALLYFGHLVFAAILIPIFGITVLPIGMLLTGNAEGFVKSVGSLHWGLFSTVYGVSFIAAMANRPGLALFFVLIIQFNDVAQFCWGKSIGRRKIAPRLSPNKTLEGFVGGAFTTAIVALVAGPYLAELPLIDSIIFGAGLSIFGFFGDLMMSAVKRDLGIKDFSTLIPGHGGVLDRIDSLICAAPLFFCVVNFDLIWR